MKEQEIFNTAIEKLTELTGATVLPIETRRRKYGDEIDAVIEVTLQKIRRIFDIEIKNEIRIGNLQALINLKKNTGREFLLICQYIPMPLKLELKLNQINYLEAAGNCYIQAPGIFLYINNQQVTEIRTPAEGKLWKAAGLKFLFAVMQDQEIINTPYRNIADHAKIALGNVGGLLEELRKEGFLRDGLKTNNFLDNRERLIQRWTEAYMSNLRPKLVIGNFRFIQKETMRNWKAIQEGFFKWGGENAGAILTDYLGPEKFTIYTAEPRNKMMQKLKLVPDPNGPVELVQQFWKDDDEQQLFPKETVPPLLAYAELITSFDSRNRETAERIKTKYLA